VSVKSIPVYDPEIQLSNTHLVTWKMESVINEVAMCLPEHLRILCASVDIDSGFPVSLLRISPIPETECGKTYKTRRTN
jgi:hypothetical protein